MTKLWIWYGVATSGGRDDGSCKTAVCQIMGRPVRSYVIFCGMIDDSEVSTVRRKANRDNGRSEKGGE